MYKIDRRMVGFKFMCDELKKKADKNYRETYHTENFRRMSPPSHRALVNYAAHYFHSGLRNGATEDEIRRLATYLLVCIDSAKHYLDYEKCREELKILDLREKYCEKEGRRND